MALVDDIEFFGRAAAAGDMTRAAAVAALVEASNGGLTVTGAEGCISDWQGVRSRYEGELQRAFHGKAAIENGRGPHPSGRPVDPA